MRDIKKKVVPQKYKNSQEAEYPSISKFWILKFH